MDAGIRIKFMSLMRTFKKDDFFNAHCRPKKTVEPGKFPGLVLNKTEFAKLLSNLDNLAGSFSTFD